MEIPQGSGYTDVIQYVNMLHVWSLEVQEKYSFTYNEWFSKCILNNLRLKTHLPGQQLTPLYLGSPKQE